MAIVRRTVFLATMMSMFLAALPLQAQTTATLNVTVRVVAECVISAELKRRIELLARQGRRTDFMHNCSKGVVSRVSERTVDWSVLRPATPLPPRIDRKKVARMTSAGRSDVVLVTVSY